MASQVDLHITNVTNWVGPDGVVKPAMLINSELSRDRC